MCGITGSGSGATAALGPAAAIATAIALDPTDTSRASPPALSVTYATLLVPL